jgi:DNA invertase Pin-like site-specific DNA recombinase
VTAPVPLPAARRRTSARAARVAAASTVAVAVLRVSTREQGDSGLGLEAQDAAVRAYAAREGITLAAVLRDVTSGTVAPADRAGMGEALRMLADGSAGILLAAKIDRLSRAQVDLYGLMDQAHRGGWHIRTADGVLNTASPNGKLMAAVAGLFAELERDLICTRTRDALTALQAQGVRLGAPISTPEPVRQRIRALRLQGLTLSAIADTLNHEHIRTAQGRPWSGPNVRRVCDSLRHDDEALARRP